MHLSFSSSGVGFAHHISFPEACEVRVMTLPTCAALYFLHHVHIANLICSSQPGPKSTHTAIPNL